jgi:hypothetical protein
MFAKTMAAATPPMYLSCRWSTEGGGRGVSRHRAERQLDNGYREYAHRCRPAPHAAQQSPPGISPPTATSHGWTGRWWALCSAGKPSPTTLNEAKSGRLGGQGCRWSLAVVGNVLTEAITVSCHRVSRSNCDAVTIRPVAHLLLSPCYTLSDTVIALAHCDVGGGHRWCA